MFSIGQTNPSLIVDLKNYRDFARRLERKKMMDEIVSEALFVLGFIVVLAALGYFLPVVLPLR